MKERPGYLLTNIKLIRGLWHVERRVNNRWVVKLFDHYPSETEVDAVFA